MKKSISMCLVFFAMVLSGCGESGALQDFPSSKDLVLNADLIDATFETEEETIVTVAKKPKQAVSDVNFYRDYIISNYSSNGLLVVRNNDNYIGFYSLLSGQYLMNRQFVPSWVDYSVTPNSHVGFFLKLRNNDIYYILDGFGNVLYQASDDVDYCSTTMVGTSVFSTIVDSKSASRYYQYSKTGEATIVTSIPTQVVEIKDDGDKYDGPSYGDIFDESWVDLTGYGLPDYFLASNDNGNYTTYYNDNPVTSFYVDKSISTPLGIVGGNFVYQTKLTVPEDANEYDYFDVSSKTKYSLETVLINLKTGKKENKKYAAVISNIYPLKNKNKEINNYIIVYQRINDSHILAEYNTKVIDKNFTTHDNISGFEPEAFKKIADNRYYNLVTKILYDENLKPITYLGKMEPVYVPNLKMFMGTLKGKYGFVDLDGKVATEFKYDYLYSSDFVNENIIARKGDSYYRLNPKSNKSTLIGKNVSRIGENLFSLRTDTDLQFFSSDKTISSTKNFYNIVTGQATFLGTNKAYFFYGSNGTQTDGLYFNTIIYEDFTPKTVSSATQGSEKSGTIYDGNSYEYPQPLSLGDNNIHGLRTTYLQYRPTRMGYYSFYFDKQNVSISGFYKGESFDSKVNVSYETSTLTSKSETKCTALLDTNTTYILKITYSGTKQLTKAFVEMETGANSNYPYYASLRSGDTNKLSIPRDYTSASKFYVNITGDEKKKYTISIPSQSGYTVTCNGRDVTSGLNIANGVTKSLIVTLRNSISSGTAVDFTIVKSAPGIDEGYGQNVPLSLTYGSNSSIISTSGFAFNSDGGVNTYGYVAFTATYAGIYSASFTFNSSSSYYVPSSSTLYKVSSTGGLTSLTTATSSTINSNNISLNENEGVLLKFSLSSNDKNTYLSTATISASSGQAYENPITLSNTASTTLSTNGGLVYYKIAASNTSKSLSINSESNSLTIKKIVDGGSATTISKGTNAIEASEKPTYIFIKNTSTSASADISLILASQFELENVLTTNTSSVGYYTYQNSGNSTKTVYLTYSMSSSNTSTATFYYGIDASVDSLNQIYITPYSSSTMKFNIPSKSTLIVGVNFSYTVKLLLSAEAPDYVVNFKSNNQYLTFNQKYANSNYEYYSPSTSRGTAEMSITVMKAGSLAFYYKSYSYNSSNDYLVILVNGVQSISKQNSSSSSYLSYTINNLNANDVVTFRWVKGSTNTSSTYYGAIRNITFTPANS